MRRAPLAPSASRCIFLFIPRKPMKESTHFVAGVAFSEGSYPWTQQGCLESSENLSESRSRDQSVESLG